MSLESKVEEVEKNTDGGAISLKEKGDQLYKKKKYQEALKCYSQAIIQDASNLELLLCRAQVYYDLGSYGNCLSDAQKIVSLSNDKGKKYKPVPVYKALILIALTKKMYMSLNGYVYSEEERKRAFMQAMHCAPAIEIEPLISEYNAWRRGFYTSFTLKTLEAGVMLYSYGNIIEAINAFTEEISRCMQTAPQAYACRAVCYATKSQWEKELLADIKECIDLDYRFHNYFLKKADDFKLLGQMDASFRLYKALSSSAETYKLSVGRFIPNLLLGKQLSKSEKKRFKDLDESWRKKYLLPLEKLYENSIPDSDSDSDSDSHSENIEAVKGSGEATNDNEHASCMRQEGDKLFEEKKFEEALKFYNKAIEQDQTNLELLLSRAKVYFGMKKYSECINEANKLVALCTGKERCKSATVFKALRLIVSSYGLMKSHDSARNYCLKAMQFSVSLAEIEPLITEYNALKFCRNDQSIDEYLKGAIKAVEELEAGLMLYAQDDVSSARHKLIYAINLDASDPLAYACRAVLSAEQGMDALGDVRACIDRDYRFLNYFVEKADQLRLDGQMDAGCRLYKALSSVEDTYRSSVVNFFPKLTRNKRLDGSDRKRFKDLEESWRERYSPTLERFK